MKTRISTFSYSSHSTVPTAILCFVSTLVCLTKSRNKLSKRKKKKKKLEESWSCKTILLETSAFELFTVANLPYQLS